MFKFFSWIKSLFKKSEPTLGPNVPNLGISPSQKASSPTLPNWQEIWEKCEIDPEHQNAVDVICRKITRAEPKLNYQLVEKNTGVPWELVAALHYRESSLDFTTYLHNGEKLGTTTKLVPKGIYFGKNQWHEAAEHAMRHDNLHVKEYKKGGDYLVAAEKFNGLGYRKTNEYSPYVLAGTNQHDETGKYVADGKYSATAQEKQIGVAAILIGLGVKQKVAAS